MPVRTRSQAVAETATAPATPPTLVCGVDLARVDGETLTAALEAAGLPSAGKLADLVTRLTTFELEACPDDTDLPEGQRKGGGCSECGGFSQLSRPACPYCGTAEEQPEALSAVKVLPKSVVKAHEAEQRRKEKANARLLADAPKVVVTAEAGGKVTAANKKEFERCVDRVRGLMADMMADTTVAQWRIGQELLAIYDKGIFKFRVDAAGKPLYSFTKFCETELNIGDQHARDFMKVAKVFSEAKVREIGATKCRLLTRLPEELRELLLEKAADPATTTRELEQEVRAINPAPAKPGGRKPRTPPTPSEARPSRVVASNEVTVAIVLKEPQPVQLVDGAGTLDLQNSVRACFKLEGSLLVVEFKRESAEAAE